MQPDIDLVIPCYNPQEIFADLIGENFKDLKSTFPDRHINLVIVNDGSSHNFSTIQIQQLMNIDQSVQIISYEKNQGKGYALRKAILETKSPLIVYTDYDFPFKMNTLINLITELDKGADIVLASRNEGYLNILTPARKFYSLMLKTLNRVILRMRIYETQSGLKGFNIKGKDIFLQTTVKGFLFDTEFIYRATLQKNISIVSVDGRIRDGIKPNRISLGVVGRELLNFYKITKIRT